MSTSQTVKTNRVCPGPGSICTNSRRGFLQAGLAGFATLSLPGILRLQAQNALRERNWFLQSREECCHHGLAARWLLAPGNV